MGERRRFATLAALAVAALFPACDAGRGSDIGPKIETEPEEDWRIVVADDAGRAVTAAFVTIRGMQEHAATNRSGRASIVAAPRGTRVVTVEGSQASATAADRLAGLSLAWPLPDGGELPFALFLPDTAPSATLTLSTGTQGSSSTLDDSATTGAIVTVAAGSSVGYGSAMSVVLRTGMLSAEHVPPGLPAPAAGLPLPTRAIFVDPVDVAFAPGASLSVPNDVQAAANTTLPLWFLDPATGVWTAAGSGTVNGAGTRIDAPGAVARGGLYCFVAPIAAGAFVTGQVIDAAQPPLQLAGVLVRAGESTTRTLGNGNFTLGPIAATDAAGGPRTVALRLTGGRSQRPVSLQRSLALQSGTVDAGVLVLETGTVAEVKAQLVVKGKSDAFRTLRMSTDDGRTLGLSVTDATAQSRFEDQATGLTFGMLSSRIKDRYRVFVARAVAELPPVRRQTLLQIFGSEVDWWSGRSQNGITTTYVVDRTGTGPARYVAVIRDSIPGQGFVGYTTDAGTLGADYGIQGQATASAITGADGVTVTGATTFADVDTDRIELPLERAARKPIGAFDRHGLYAGVLTGSGQPGRTFRVRSGGPSTLQEWYEATLYGTDLGPATPKKVDPESGGSFYRVGVPAPQGDLAVVEGVAGAGTFTVERAAVRKGLAPIQGGLVSLDLTLDLVADQGFLSPGSASGLDVRIPLSALRFDWGVQYADGLVVDVARGLSGFVVNGADVSFPLPALGGTLAGARHVVAFGGSASAGGTTVTQKVFLPLDQAVNQQVTLLGIPEIQTPLPGATVDRNGFTVRWVVPFPALYVVVRLRAESPAKVHEWTAIVPSNLDSFTFRQLPAEAPQPLQPATTYTLSVTAMRIQNGILSTEQRAYQYTLTHYVGLGEADREVNAFSTMSIQVTTTP